MGHSSSSYGAPMHFVGDWTDGWQIFMRIEPDGQVTYSKEGSFSQTSYSSRGHFSINEVWVNGLFSTKIYGVYHRRNGRSPIIVIDGVMLKRKPLGSLGTLMTTMPLNMGHIIDPMVSFGFSSPM